MEEGHRRCLQGGDNLWQIADAFSQSRWVQISGRQLIFAYGDTRISPFLYKVKHDNVMAVNRHMLMLVNYGLYMSF
jgi:hypothetical protein